MGEVYTGGWYNVEGNPNEPPKTGWIKGVDGKDPVPKVVAEGKGYTQEIENIPNSLLAIMMQVRAYIDVTRKVCGPDAKIDVGLLKKFDGEDAKRMFWGNDPNSWADLQTRLYNLFYAHFWRIYDSQSKKEVISLSDMYIG